MVIRNALAAMLIATLSGCGLFPEAITVPGPESNSLLPEVRGYIVMDRPPGGMVAIELPTLREMTVRPQSPSNANDCETIHMFSDPDDKGRIAYIENHMSLKNDQNSHHLLKTIRLDGTDDITLFTRPGDAGWATTVIGRGEIGERMALAPTGGRVAFLTDLKSVQMPLALLQQGVFEMWNIEGRTGIKTEIIAIDEGLCWFPDGKRLSYVKLVESKDIPNPDAIANGFVLRNWDRIPAVFIRDVETQSETFLHAGWRPIVSVDGSEVLIADSKLSYYRVEVATGKTSALTGPGKDGPIAMLDKTTLLAGCYPTAGTKVKFTGAWPVNGPAEVYAIKLTKTDSRTFQTVVPYSSSMASFGLGER